MERSPFSDTVFMEAMFKEGYIRKECEHHSSHLCVIKNMSHVKSSFVLVSGVEHYNEIRNISICEFLPPHLTIYIDVPAEEVQKKLKQSGQVV